MGGSAGDRHAILVHSLSIHPNISNIHSPEHPPTIDLELIPASGFWSTIHADCLAQDTLSYFDFAQHISNLTNRSEPFESVYHLLLELNSAIPKYIDHSCRSPDDIIPTRFDYLLDIHFNSPVGLANRLTLSSHTSLLHLTQIHIKHIKVHSIIGILPHERITKQDILISLSIASFRHPPHVMQSLLNIETLSKSVYNYASQTNFQTVETLANSIINHLILDFQNKNMEIESTIKSLTVKVEKPQAVSNASGVGVQITRSFNTR